MSVIIKDIAQVRNDIEESSDRLRELWNELAARADRHALFPGLIQPGDDQEWWHLAMERITDAAFVQAVRPTKKLGSWLRNVVLDICCKDIDEWIGPWYRPRRKPPLGALETAHVGISIAVVYDLCPELFCEEELARIRESLRKKAQEPCRRYAESILGAQKNINNWYMVLIDGFGTVSAVLNDAEAVKTAVEYFKVAESLYNSDSYGESVQYSNYATLHMSFLYEVLVRYDAALASVLDISCYTKLMPWYASSLMYRKPLAGWGENPLPRTVNFGDSAAIFRPTGDVLLQVASRMKEKYPQEAGLARWLFETTYAEGIHLPTSRASFGFINQFQFFSILFYNDAAAPLSPEEVGLPLLTRYEVGSILIRDRWENPEMVLGIQGGFRKCNVTSHRHLDQNSFILAYRQERFFADPGHCCYRLKSQSFSASAETHNTWSFLLRENGTEKLLEQNIVTGNIYQDTPCCNRLNLAAESGGVAVVVSDAAEMYGTPVKKAQRIWIAVKPHVLFIVDRIEADKPLCVKTHFLLNNRDNRLRVHEAAKTKFVFRRFPATMKFFQVCSKTDGSSADCDLSYDWGYIHDCYHPLPNQKGQGAEGSGLIYNYTSKEGKSHVFVYAIVMDCDDRIKGWHIRTQEDGSFLAESPEKLGGCVLKMEQDDSFIVEDRDQQRFWRLTDTDFSEKDLKTAGKG